MTPGHPEPSDFINGLDKGPDGVWRTRGVQAVSYPDDGHDTCHEIEDRSFWFEHRMRCIEAMVERFAPPPGLPFIDVGGGNGFVAARLQARGLRAVLVEPGARGVANARARGVRELVQGATSELDIIPGRVGAVGLFDVLEHLESPVDALRDLHRALAPGGRLYATVPAHDWLWSSVDELAGHYRRYTRRSIAALLREGGFDLDMASYNFWLLPAPMYLLRCLPERMRGRRTEARAARAGREHTQGGGLARRLLAPEPALLRRGIRVPFGASCIVAATRRVDGR